MQSKEVTSLAIVNCESKLSWLAPCELALVILIAANMLTVAVGVLLGVSGHALTPYGNGIHAAFLGGLFLALALVYWRRLTLFLPGASYQSYFLALFAMAPISLGVGAYHAWPTMYMVADIIYMTVPAVIYIVTRQYYAESGFGYNLFQRSLILLTVALIFSLIFNARFSPPNVFLLIVLGLVFVASRNYLLFGIIAAALVLFIFSGGSNRAMVLSVLTLMPILIFAGVLRRILLIVLTVTLLVLYTLFFKVDPSAIPWASHRLVELITIIQRIDTPGLMLFNWDTINLVMRDQVAIFQRFWEALQVIEFHGSANILTNMFGAGAGAVLDFSTSLDTAVMGSSLLGKEAVHNIHFHPFLMYLRWGYVGVVLWLFLLLTTARVVIREARQTSVRISFVFVASIVVLLGFVYAQPAGNHWHAQFMWPVFMGYVDGVHYWRQKRAPFHAKASLT